MSVPTSQKLTTRNPGDSPPSAFGASPSSRRVARIRRRGMTGGQPRGSRVAPFAPTEEETEQMLASKLQSICGGPNHADQSGASVGPGASFAIPRPTFSRSSPFSSTAASNAVSSAPASTTKLLQLPLLASLQRLRKSWTNVALQAPAICRVTVPVYKYKNHEELRWEDYRRGDQGGPNHAGQSGVSVGPGASFAIPPPTFSQSSSGTIPAVQQLSIGFTKTGSSVQYARGPVQFFECLVCLNNPKNMAFGCGHMTCGECGRRLSSCPICRQPITIRLRLYM